MTKTQMKIARVTAKNLKIEWTKTIEYFKSRDEYKLELKRMIKKYGIAGLPMAVQRTIPVDRKVLHERVWYWHPSVWLRILQITWLNTENEGMRRALHG